MTLWQVREQALAHPDLKSLHKLLETGFDLFDQGLKMLERHFGDHDLARLAGVFLLKGKNLAVGCYSLTLDGMAQESGALLRPFLEALEKAQYLRTVPGAIQRVQEDDFPKAGEIAKAIDSSFKDVRDYLNNSASHTRLDFHALHNLVRVSEEGLELVTRQPFRVKTTAKNLITLAAFVEYLLRELLLCLQEVEGECPESLIDQEELYRRSVLLHYELEQAGANA